MKIEIKEATENDIKEIHQIEIDGSNMWKESQFSDELTYDFSRMLLAKQNNVILGFIVAWILPGEIQINNIAVNKNYRQKGIGKLLLNEIIERFSKIDCDRVFLEVKEKNIVAQQFYKLFNFKEIYIRKNYYRDDNAIVMEKVL